MHELAGGSRRIVTIRSIWPEYQLSRKLKPSTVALYEQRMKTHLSDWLDIPIQTISKDMIEERHRSIAGHAAANSVMRTLRSFFTFAQYKYVDDCGDSVIKLNPVKRLSEVRAWNREKRRTRVLRPAQLPIWFRAVFGLKNSTLRDLLLLILLTGLRKSEATELKWSQVDLVHGIIHLYDTKNNEDFELPMSDFVWQLLSVRKIGANGEYVFPGRIHGSGTSLAWKSYREVCEATGIDFSPHDLRRTFITIGDELDMKNEVIKALVNHRTKDVTEGYIIRSAERLRRATQRITDGILKYGGVRKFIP